MHLGNHSPRKGPLREDVRMPGPCYLHHKRVGPSSAPQELGRGINLQLLSKAPHLYQPATTRLSSVCMRIFPVIEGRLPLNGMLDADRRLVIVRLSRGPVGIRYEGQSRMLGPELASWRGMGIVTGWMDTGLCRC
ncbi:hypothetical protein VFPBJ_11610 [Purpureocillium lilacinum]|uniref:Uncharacterized protein n=1 Tax=Purpureocillium lilacinum TaxID=33203 RepID=A0A179F242_PURLI|nr:hypothetical protein VFPBJ_11610 [Purpureocillium lilacinum]